jgi:choline dehydrogenase-like flavoprotein
VIDASLHPAPLSAHPVATIMVVAEKAADVLSRQLGGS